MNIDKGIRWIAGIMAIGAWVLSIVFSVQGFGFQDSKYKIAGVFLALLVTLFEILVNREGARLPRTLLFCGLLAYLYGGATNVAGIYYAQGSANLQTNPQSALVPIVLGILLEVFPEPLFMFSVGVRGRDLIDALAVMLGRSRRGQQVVPNHFEPVNPSRQRAYQHKNPPNTP